jgi:hypothetical protein
MKQTLGMSKLEQAVFILTLIATMAFIVSVFAGCATQRAWVVGHKSEIAQTAQVIGIRAGKIAASCVLDAAVSQIDRENKQDFLDGLAGEFYRRRLEPINSDDMKAIVKIWTPQKPHWEEMGNEFAALWAQYNPKTQAEVSAFLDAYAKALNDQRTTP